MCRTGLRHCRAKWDRDRKDLENARRRITRNTAKATAAAAAGDEVKATAYQHLAAQADVAVTDLTERIQEHQSNQAKTSSTATGGDSHPAAAIANADASPATFGYARRTESAPAMGAAYAQDIEVAGRYITARDAHGNYPEDLYETGEVSFDQPLRMDFGGGYADESNWKRRLSAHYGGKTGIGLAEALASDGYDGVITSDEYGTCEIVDLTGYHSRTPSSVDGLAPASVKGLYRSPYADTDTARSNRQEMSSAAGGDTPDWAETPIERFDPATLSHTQAGLSGENLRHLETADIQQPGRVIRANGKDYLQDGHHRAHIAATGGGAFTAHVWEPAGNGRSPTSTVAGLTAHLESTHPGLAVHLTDSSSGYVTLDSIKVPNDDRNHGIGTKAMEALTAAADHNGWDLALTPSADYGGTVSRLKKFYKRFGFVENKGKHKDYATKETFLRHPR